MVKKEVQTTYDGINNQIIGIRIVMILAFIYILKVPLATLGSSYLIEIDLINILGIIFIIFGMFRIYTLKDRKADFEIKYPALLKEAKPAVKKKDIPRTKEEITRNRWIALGVLCIIIVIVVLSLVF